MKTKTPPTTKEQGDMLMEVLKGMSKREFTYLYIASKICKENIDRLDIEAEVVKENLDIRDEKGDTYNKSAIIRVLKKLSNIDTKVIESKTVTDAIIKKITAEKFNSYIAEYYNM